MSQPPHSTPHGRDVYRTQTLLLNRNVTETTKEVEQAKARIKEAVRKAGDEMNDALAELEDVRADIGMRKNALRALREAEHLAFDAIDMGLIEQEESKNE